jgi:RNA methyltransferase, TrmH family
LLRRTQRSKEHAFLLEGRIAILDAIASGARINEVFVVLDDDTEPVVAAATKAGVDVFEVAPQVLGVLSETVTPQGVVAVARSTEVSLEDLRPDPQLILVLAGVNDPGNAGTLLRSAAAAGADGVVFAEGSVDPFNPKVVRSSAAALFHVPIVRAVPLEEVAGTMKAGGCTLLGAVAGGKNVFTEVDLTQPAALFLGNEAGGLPDPAGELVDELVAVPMPGGMESLNVSAAGSILLFEIVRQRHFSG